MRWGCVLTGYWLLLFVGTHLPPSITKGLPGIEGGSDKLTHYAAFAGLTLLFAAFLSDRRWTAGRAFVLVVGVVVPYAVLDELIQDYVGRRPDFWDLVADLGGVLTALVVARFFYPWRRPSAKPFHISV